MKGKDDVRPQAANDLTHVVIQPAHNGRNPDHHGDPDNDAQHGQSRPQFVTADGVQRHADNLAVIAFTHHDAIYDCRF